MKKRVKELEKARRKNLERMNLKKSKGGERWIIQNLMKIERKMEIKKKRREEKEHNNKKG